MRGILATGEQTFTEVAPVATDAEFIVRAIADTSGGLLLVTGTYGGGFSLVRSASPASAPPWRYESRESLDGEVAQGPDGTIYFVESDSTSRSVVGLDGETGQTKFRLPIIRTSWWYTYNTDCNHGWTFGNTYPADATSPAIGSDGMAYLELHSETDDWDYEPCGAGTGHQTGRVELMRVTPDGAATYVSLTSFDNSYGLEGMTLGLGVGQVVPGDQGGTLATWTWITRSGETTSGLRGGVHRSTAGCGAGVRPAPWRRASDVWRRRRGLLRRRNRRRGSPTGGRPSYRRNGLECGWVVCAGSCPSGRRLSGGRAVQRGLGFNRRRGHSGWTRIWVLNQRRVLGCRNVVLVRRGWKPLGIRVGR